MSKAVRVSPRALRIADLISCVRVDDRGWTRGVITSNDVVVGWLYLDHLRTGSAIHGGG